MIRVTRKKIVVAAAAVLLLAILAGTGILAAQYLERKQAGIGEELDSFKSVPVFYNGSEYTESYGKSYSPDGYYYGYKWQCVEYVKRFYYEAKGHKMPDVFGNAKDFFDPEVPQGGLNKRRGLVQYKNGGNVKPEPDDLMVFTDTTFGHVVIVTEVTDSYVEYIQQNMQTTTRSKLNYEVSDGNYFVGTGEQRKPAGWLRKKDK